MSFSKRLKKLRKNRGIYQKELANEIGVSRPTITQYEAGTRKPDHETLKKIANYFDVSIDYLLGNADKIKKAISDDPELTDFWDKLSKRDDLKLLFKQTKDMEPEDVKRIIRVIKAIEDEEQERYN